MEQHEKTYIAKITPELIKLITLNVTIIARLHASDILSEEDSAELQALPNLLERKQRFLDILKTKPDGYKLLTEALKEVKQGGAVLLLEQIPLKVSTNQDKQTSSTSDVQQSASKSGSGKQVDCLDFGDHDIKNTVLPMVQADLVSKMNSKEANTKIISQLAALNYFDRDEIQILLTGEHRSQQMRMLELFAEIANLDDDEILNCFKKLCNLDDQRQASGRFRKIFQKHFPECL